MGSLKYMELGTSICCMNLGNILSVFPLNQNEGRVSVASFTLHTCEKMPREKSHLWVHLQVLGRIWRVSCSSGPCVPALGHPLLPLFQVKSMQQTLGTCILSVPGPKVQQETRSKKPNDCSSNRHLWETPMLKLLGPHPI